MLAREFDYHLPEELIAQHPAEPRDHSRLMHVHRGATAVTHHRFDELPALLQPGDLLVFNDTHVLRARLRGWKIGEDGSRGARIEGLLLREVPPAAESVGEIPANEEELQEPGSEGTSSSWEALLKPSARLKPGSLLRFFSEDESVSIDARPVSRTEQGWIVRFEGDVREVLPRLGEVPLPPYITSAAAHEIEERYQTIYAADKRALESAAAPTAGLHFTPRVFEALRERGIEMAFVTLQIGIGTFRPIQAERLNEHTMHQEFYEITSECAERIAQQKARGGRVIAVGTTAVRVLESAADENGALRVGSGATSLFITPGYKFRVIDALITNFHLPRSTLLVMISALAGLHTVRAAYEEAVTERYRFFFIRGRHVH